MRFAIILGLIGAFWMKPEARNEAYLQYIDQFAHLAVAEMRRTGIPASIKLAQALLESNAGRSTLALQAKNHFGIKCGPAWSGKTFYLEDDDYKNGKLIKSCFRVYPDAYDSYISHSEFLQKTRYQFLFNYGSSDYKSWARGLKKAGYATHPRYPELLIKLVDDYELYRYDQPGVRPTITLYDDEIEEVAPFFDGAPKEVFFTEGIQQRNGLQVVITRPGQTVEHVSFDYGVPVSELMKFNEHLMSRDQILEENSRIYLEKKKTKYGGRSSNHRVKTGETMQSIAQFYGIRLKSLHKLNRIPEGTEPVPGELLSLSKKVKKGASPKYFNAPAANHPVATIGIQNDIEPLRVKDDDQNGNVPEKVLQNPTGGTMQTREQKEPTPSNPEVPIAPVEEIKQEASLSSEKLLHTVVKGDTLYNLSRRYRLTVDEIKEINNLTDNVIKIGQQLRVQK